MDGGIRVRSSTRCAEELTALALLNHLNSIGLFYSQHFGYLAERSYPSSVECCQRFGLFNLNEGKV